jgi:outer membrane protein assembly factor BamE (lipoprotein component of BamABCDE complex)
MRMVQLSYSILVALAIILIQGCASSGAVSDGYTCPATMGGFKEGESTSAEVKHCIGNPFNEDHYHYSDGKYDYLYVLNDGTIVHFLFDSSDKLISITGYESNISKKK